MIGKILGGRYELLEKIGGGGMAIVYKARCHLLKRYVAVKVLRPEFVEDDEFIYRFKRESQAAASLSHQNIVNIYDVGQEENIHYIVMEYVKGETLKDLIRRNKRLKPEDAVDIAIQICSALEHAHRNHVIHRDIKPQNILVGEDGTVKVTDFGIARAATSSTVTIASTNVIGSVHYFSPEQARGGFTDEKSDLYSLGIVLYEMVTGTVPFQGDSPISVAIKHIQEFVKPPMEINPNVPRSLQDIILKSIEKDQNKRYASAREMEEDLRRSLREPNGDFVKRFLDSDAPTQAIPIIREDDISGEISKNRLEEKAVRKNKEAKFKILRMIIAVIVILGLFTTLFLIARSIYNNNFRVVEIPTPQVTQMSVIEAKNALTAYGLRIEVTHENSDEYAEGIVMSQSPEAGEPIKKGDVVKVIASKGPKKIQVPKVIQEDYATAANKIEAAGLEVGKVEEVHTDKVAKGYVVEQNPKPGEEVIPGYKIDLWIAKPLAKEVPPLIGLTLEQAEALLKSKGLVRGKVYRENNEAEPGTVFKQEPVEGTEISDDSAVNLWVSKGELKSYSKEITIPLEGIEDQTIVRIVLVDESGNITYSEEGEYNKDQKEINISLNGYQGIQTLIVYFNGEEKLQRTINFNTKEDS